MCEIWKDVKGYEGLYQVSNLGRVRSLDRWIIYKDGKKRLWKGQMLKPLKSKSDYWRVCLLKNQRRKYEQIHRLVASAFIPNPSKLPQVNHKDRDIHNNSADNLEWCTNQYNVEYSLAKAVLQFDLQGNFIREWVSAADVEKQLGFAKTHISSCCNKKKYNHTAYGFKWEFK